MTLSFCCSGSRIIFSSSAGPCVGRGSGGGWGGGQPVSQPQLQFWNCHMAQIGSLRILCYQAGQGTLIATLDLNLAYMGPSSAYVDEAEHVLREKLGLLHSPATFCYVLAWGQGACSWMAACYCCSMAACFMLFSRPQEAYKAATTHGVTAVIAIHTHMVGNANLFAQDPAHPVWVPDAAAATLTRRQLACTAVGILSVARGEQWEFSAVGLLTALQGEHIGHADACLTVMMVPVPVLLTTPLGLGGTGVMGKQRRSCFFHKVSFLWVVWV